jgi:hypothetical protein
MPSLEVWANLLSRMSNIVFFSHFVFLLFSCQIKYLSNSDFLFLSYRDSVKPAFQSIPRRAHVDTSMMWMNSGDCSNEIEDDMLPWLLEDWIEDSVVVSMQWSIEKQGSLFLIHTHTHTLSLSSKNNAFTSRAQHPLLLGLNAKCRIDSFLSTPSLAASLALSLTLSLSLSLSLSYTYSHLKTKTRQANNLFWRHFLLSPYLGFICFFSNSYIQEKMSAGSVVRSFFCCLFLLSCCSLLARNNNRTVFSTPISLCFFMFVMNIFRQHKKTTGVL